MSRLEPCLLSSCFQLAEGPCCPPVAPGLLCTPAQADCHFFASLQTLYFSKNCLRSLQGIQQFSALVTLAVADNLIDSFDQLEFLSMASEGHMLRALSLEGNPIARLPNYRSVQYSAAS